MVRGAALRTRRALHPIRTGLTLGVSRVVVWLGLMIAFPFNPPLVMVIGMGVIAADLVVRYRSTSPVANPRVAAPPAHVLPQSFAWDSSDTVAQVVLTHWDNEGWLVVDALSATGETVTVRVPVQYCRSGPARSILRRLPLEPARIRFGAGWDHDDGHGVIDILLATGDQVSVSAVNVDAVGRSR